MFRRTSPQRPLFGVEHRIDPAKRARLERTWAHQYRCHALPLIDEGRFAKYFDSENGRPNKSVRLVVSVLVLKEVFDLTDAEALEQLEWNATWQYALDVVPEEAHACQKTLHNYRTLVIDDDEGAGLFESTTARLIKAAGLRTGRQRQDSTHIVSNIRLLTRLGLFVQTITQFLEALRNEHPPPLPTGGGGGARAVLGPRGLLRGCARQRSTPATGAGGARPAPAGPVSVCELPDGRPSVPCSRTVRETG